MVLSLFHPTFSITLHPSSAPSSYAPFPILSLPFPILRSSPLSPHFFPLYFSTLTLPFPTLSPVSFPYSTPFFPFPPPFGYGVWSIALSSPNEAWVGPQPKSNVFSPKSSIRVDNNFSDTGWKQFTRYRYPDGMFDSLLRDPSLRPQNWETKGDGRLVHWFNLVELEGQRGAWILTTCVNIRHFFLLH